MTIEQRALEPVAEPVDDDDYEQILRDCIAAPLPERER